MQSHYYVYRPGDFGPQVKHATLEAAEKEAMRLAEKHPGQVFEILQSLAMVRTAKPEVFWADGVIPPHDCNFHRAMNGDCLVCGK